MRRDDDSVEMVVRGVTRAAMVPLLPDSELERHIQRGSIEGEFINWAIECHTALLVNQIEPAGPPSICLLSNVVESIDGRDERDFELAHAGGGVLALLLERRGVR